MDDINSIVSFRSGGAPASEAKAEPAATETPKGEEAAPPAANGSDPATEKQGETTGEKATQARDDKGKFTKADDAGKTAESAAAPAAKADEKPAEKPTGQLAALMAERTKRQQLERELAELRGGKPAAKPSVLEDEDAAFSSRIDEGTRGLREQMYHLSMDNARLRHGDAFAEAEEAFANAAEKDERLIDALRNSANPGEYVFKIGVQVKELVDVGGDILKYREKVTADSKRQIDEQAARIKTLEAEIASLKQTQTAREEVPESLNRQPSGAVPARESDTDIRNIVRFKSG